MSITTCRPAGTKFDPVKAERAYWFIQSMLRHTKSEWAHRHFILPNWQANDIIRPLFGTVRYDELFRKEVRQYLLAWLEVARKNGKSELMAAIGLYLLLMDGEESAEIYGCASDRDQASAVFNVAKRMCEVSPRLSRWVDDRRIIIVASRKKIIVPETNSVYMVVSADAAGNLGSNPSGVLFDEVLTQPNRDLWDAFVTAEGTRAQMLMIAATTAGDDPQSFCYGEHEFSLKVANEPELDPTRFVYIRHLPEDADWMDEANWPMANPALGDFKKLSTIRNALHRALNRGDLKEQATFRQFHCNQWQKSKNRWIDMSVWADNFEVNGEFEEVEAEGLQGWGGLDLAETNDFTAWVMVFQDTDKFLIIPRFWIPREAIDKKHSKIKPFLESWEAQGYLKVTEGSTVDYDEIIEDIIADLEVYGITKIGYDQFQAPSVVQAIEKSTDVVCVKVPQTTSRMSAPSKEMMRILGRREMAHNNHPVLTWMADNVAVQTDREGNIKPSKLRSPEKIDGITALVDALFVKLIPDDDDDQPGIFVLEDEDNGED